eukprot:2094146-Rhodomonas_salina.1
MHSLEFDAARRPLFHAIDKFGRFCFPLSTRVPEYPGPRVDLPRRAGYQWRTRQEKHPPPLLHAYPNGIPGYGSATTSTRTGTTKYAVH